MSSNCSDCISAELEAHIYSEIIVALGPLSPWICDLSSKSGDNGDGVLQSIQCSTTKDFLSNDAEQNMVFCNIESGIFVGEI